MPTLHLALNMDDRYLQHAVVMLTSVFVNSPGAHFVVYVLTDGLSDGVKTQLSHFIEKDYGNECHICELSEAQAHLFPEYVNSHISLAANYRLFLSEFLPEDVHKVLYLDCDLVVEESVESLFTLNMDVAPVAAVEDMFSGKSEVYERLGYPYEEGYFNSGVLLVNLDAWRSRKLSLKFVEFAQSHDNLVFYDQDTLNGVLHGQWLALPPRWNVQDGFLRRHCHVREEKMEMVRAEAVHPAIVHYSGHRKPWLYDHLNPYANRYYHYLDMTSWKGWRPEVPAAYRRRQALYQVLYAIHLKPKRYDARYKPF